MDLHLTVQGVALIIALIGNFLLIAYVSGRVIEKLGSIDDSIRRLDRELEKRDTDSVRQREEMEAKFKTVFNRIDQIRDMIPSGKS